MVALSWLGSSDQEMLLSEIDWPSPYVQQIQRLVRISLTSLDALDGGW